MKTLENVRKPGMRRFRTVSVLSGLILCLFLFSAAVFADSAPQNSKIAGASGRAADVVQTYGSVSSYHALDTPTGFRITVKGLGKLFLKWDDVYGADYYTILEKIPGTTEYENLGRVYDNSCELLNNFQAGKKYYYKIRAYSYDGDDSGYSSSVRVIPKEKQGVITATVSGRSVKLSVRWIATAKQYQIARKEGSNGQYRGITTRTSRTYTDTNRTSGKYYYYRYRAVYKYNGRTMYGAWSPSVRVKISGGGSGGGSTVYRALCIGNSNYTYASNLGQAPYLDAVRTKEMLVKRGYSKVTVKKDVSTKSAMLSAIRSAFSGAKSTDVSLFLYSGHGICDCGNNTYEGALCPTGLYYSNDALTLGELASALSKIPGKVVILLDSCGSGGGIYASSSGKISPLFAGDEFDPDAFNLAVTSAFSAADEYVPEEGDDSSKTGELRKNKFYVITASAYKEVSYTSNPGSLFTMEFVNGAGYKFANRTFVSGKMPADSNSDNKLSLKEAYNYVSPRTSPRQHAKVYPSNSTQVILKK